MHPTSLLLLVSLSAAVRTGAVLGRVRIFGRLEADARRLVVAALLDLPRCMSERLSAWATRCSITAQRSSQRYG